MPVLPLEILHDIISFSLGSLTSPAALLTASSVLHNVTQRVLYGQLYFKSRPQLLAFISTFSLRPVPCSPRSVELHITGDGSHVFLDLFALFGRCLAGDSTKDAERDEKGRLCLDLMLLHVNSYAFYHIPEMIYTGLSLIKQVVNCLQSNVLYPLNQVYICSPRRFIWTGPDPPHHFSTAVRPPVSFQSWYSPIQIRLQIVPQALPYLFSALSSYTNLTDLKLTHLSMATNIGSSSELPLLTSLKNLSLGQSTSLQPSVIAAFVLRPDMQKLEKVHLVDVYQGSIWGPRLRRSDVEQAAFDVVHGFATTVSVDGVTNDDVQKEILNSAQELIRKIVVCEARTERLVGGDRVEAHGILI
ncbi:hypothetical protein B0H34DRAFT_662398 [Crassisporium funariophilum]|nr:hypothetical protein B0H34DRAFT_662398 [Crassisporium funariophilum]